MLLKHDQRFSEMEKIMNNHQYQKDALLEILHEAQELYGYLSPEVLNYTAEEIGVKPAKVHGVATFYTQFRLNPVGKYLIMLCQGTACHVNGSKLIEEAI